MRLLIVPLFNLTLLAFFLTLIYAVWFGRDENVVKTLLTEVIVLVGLLLCYKPKGGNNAH